MLGGAFPHFLVKWFYRHYNFLFVFSVRVMLQSSFLNPCAFGSALFSRPLLNSMQTDIRCSWCHGKKICTSLTFIPWDKTALECTYDVPLVSTKTENVLVHTKFPWKDNFHFLRNKLILLKETRLCRLFPRWYKNLFYLLSIPT